MNLYKHLYDFRRPASEKELTAAFAQLAPHFIYGGYIDVPHSYRIYIRTVEFYFHDEREQSESIKDFIVYHRNRPELGVTMPYFPLMTLHAHLSGFDITFENEEQCYRASALIREYSIFDIKQKEFLPLKKNGRDDRSTFLYEYLNGFSLNGHLNIMWIDEEHTPRKALLQGKRRGVYKYRITGNPQKPYEKTDNPDERLWSFKLDENIWLPTD